MKKVKPLEFYMAGEGN